MNRKGISSKRLNILYERLNPLQQKLYRKATIGKASPEQAMKSLGARGLSVPEQLTKKNWDSIKKYL
jgi:hypothetical protein